MGLWRTRRGPVVKTGYVVVVVVIIIIIIIIIMTTTKMICNFTLVFTLYCQDETKCSIDPVSGIFYCSIRNVEK